MPEPTPNFLRRGGRASSGPLVRIGGSMMVSWLGVAVLVWFVYLSVKVAEHVHAWPF